MAKSDITGKRKLLARNVSHSNIKTKRWQHINIQSRRLWVPELGRFVRLDVTTRDLRTIDKIGLVAYAKQHGLKLLPPRQLTPHPALSPGAPRLAERSPGQRGPRALLPGNSRCALRPEDAPPGSSRRAA